MTTPKTPKPSHVPSVSAPDDAPDDVFDDEMAAEGDIELDLSQDDETAPAISVNRGAGVIRIHWEKCPMGPGVYRMIGDKDEVLYVGKAKSLKKRVASYTRTSGHVNRIARMISLTTSMIFVSTNTETEALLLETNYIKQMKPRFNVLMRDDKSFPYILLRTDHPSAQLAKHRGARSRNGHYFGPFASAGAVNRTLHVLERAFLLRTCTDSYFENRTRPCLLHQIKRCSGPCTGEIAPDDYNALVEEARDFLSGKSRNVKDHLAADMMQAAEDLEFEKAAKLRDRIAALSAITGVQGINPRSVEEADVFSIVQEAGQFCIEAFFFRTFQNWGNRAYFPRADKTMEPGDVLGPFLAQFYANKPSPRLILLSHSIGEDTEVLEEVLTQRAERKVEILVPQRGEKKDLVDHATQNAREALGRKLSDTASQEKLLAALAQAFGLDRALRRVEIYDNSHIMGTHAVGAMVVAGPAGFMKAHYRTFNIKGEDLTPGDDYGMMREVLKRRFARLMKEVPVEVPLTAADDPETFPSWPDLIIIDGGRGQFNEARTILAELGITNVAIASIAKGPDRNAGRESFFLEGREPFRLTPRDPALYFVQRLRDEAHRFAIGTHRARRKKDFTRSPLEEIAGVGPARKRALLHAFGTPKAIAQASLADLEKVPGINAATAKLVHDFFNEGNG